MAILSRPNSFNLFRLLLKNSNDAVAFIDDGDFGKRSSH